MRHNIVHLVRGVAKNYHESLTKSLVEKFNVFPIHDRFHPHLTLKRGFELSGEDMSVLYGILDMYAVTHTQSDYTMDTFGNFKEDVIFLDARPSEKMQSDVQDLMKLLQTHPTLTFDEYDNGSDFHATLTMAALKPFDYNLIRNYLATIEQPNFHMKFDNIATMKKVDDRWLIDRVWELVK
jgi:2'-5' RNA ligase